MGMSLRLQLLGVPFHSPAAHPLWLDGEKLGKSCIKLMEIVCPFSSGLHPLDAHPMVKGVRKTKMNYLLVASLGQNNLNGFLLRLLPYQQASSEQPDLQPPCIAADSETSVVFLVLSPKRGFAFPPSHSIFKLI